MAARQENRPALANLKRDALIQGALGFAFALVFGFWLSAAAGTAPVFAAAAGAIYCAYMIAAWRWLPDHLPQERLGAANLVTILRAALVANFAALAFRPEAIGALGWSLVALLSLTLAADAADGWVARRLNLQSRFGARFDQELDAIFTLIVAFMVFQAGRAGLWVLLAGAWRYVFLGLKRLWPVLRAELPFSHRRRVVCGIEIGALIVCLAPVVRPPLSTAVAGAAVLLLSLSFLIDIFWLARRPS